MSEGVDLGSILHARYVFRCKQAGVRLRDEDRADAKVVVGHLTRPPVGGRADWAPPSLQRLYDQTDGLAMFCRDGTAIDDLGADYGFVLFKAAGVSDETRRARAYLVEELGYSRDELSDQGLPQRSEPW